MSLSELPSNSIYAKLMSGFFGDQSIDKRNTLWQQFLQKEGLTTNPAETPELLAKYASYIDSIYESQQSGIANQDSQTQIMWALYDILILILSKYMKCQLNNEAVVQFLAEYQKKYQDQMSRVFFYTSNPSTTTEVMSGWGVYGVPKVPTSTDLDNVNLGYAHLTMADYVDWLYRTTAQKAPGIASTITLMVRPERLFEETSPFLSLSASRDANNVYTITINANTKILTNPGDFNSKDVISTNHIVTGTVSVPSDDNYSDFKAKAQELYTNAYTQANAVQKNYTPMVTWQKDILYSHAPTSMESWTQSNLSISSWALKSRTERNRAIQNYLDGAKTRKDVLGDKISQQQNVIDSSSSGRKQSINVLRSMLQQLQTILRAIYK